MFRIVVNGSLNSSFSKFSDAHEHARRLFRIYGKTPIITIEDKTGRVIEVIKWVKKNSFV